MPVGDAYMMAVWDILFPVAVADPFIENIECSLGVTLVRSGRGGEEVGGEGGVSYP